MPDPINLRQARKAKARADHEQTGAQNRVAFGQTKDAKSLSKAKMSLAQRRLDGLRLIKGEEA
jgi:Domain of unknown function (DUF4169)